MRVLRTFRNSVIGTSALIVAGLSAGPQIAAGEGLTDVPRLPGLPPLTTALPDGTSAHFYPTVSLDRSRKKALGSRSLSNVTYHGGPINTSVRLYTIFWAPAKLQTGVTTAMPASYKTMLTRMVQNYPGHAIANINSQYYQTVSGITTYHSGLGSFGGTYTDTAPYPTSGCNDPATPGNCISDAQIRTEIQKVMALTGWTGGFNKIFLLFTSSGEGSCFGTSCAYTQYCAYHSWFGSPATPIIYTNDPYGNNSVCQATTYLPNPGTVDSAATGARHEISEATTDPLLNAWYDGASGEDTSDKCNFNFGTRTWDFVSPYFVANYMWGGFFFLLQQEYSNHTSNCVQQGP